MEKSNEIGQRLIKQHLIKWYKAEQEQYDEAVKLRDDAEELIAYMSLDRTLGRESKIEEPLEDVEGVYKFADEWVNDIKEGLERLEKRYKELTSRDIKEDLN